MSKSFEEMNLSEFVEYFETICTTIGLDLEDGNNFAVKALNYLKEYEGTAAVKTYTQEELNEAITKALNDMTKVLEVTRKALELTAESLMRKELSAWCCFKCNKCKLYPNECVNHTEAIVKRMFEKARGQSDEKNILL